MMKHKRNDSSPRNRESHRNTKIVVCSHADIICCAHSKIIRLLHLLDKSYRYKRCATVALKYTLVTVDNQEHIDQAPNR